MPFSIAGVLMTDYEQHHKRAHTLLETRVVSNQRITPVGCAEVRHIVIDRTELEFPFREGQSVGIHIPDLEDKGHGSTLRYYSIASSRLGDDGGGRTFSICVKKIFQHAPSDGVLSSSPATQYLCGLEQGDPISLTAPAGKTLIFPDDPGSNLILVATGTGVSPFRAFLAHAFQRGAAWTGEVLLFQGCKSRDECLYQAEFESYEAHANFRYFPAYSGEQFAPDGARLYVHHRIEEQIELVWNLLDQENTYMFICGKKGTEAGVIALLDLRARRDGVSWHAFERGLRDTGRFIVETY